MIVFRHNNFTEVKNMDIKVPGGVFAADDAAERRKKLAEALRNGEQISVAPSGEVITKEEADLDPAATTITVPEGKLAR